MEYGNFRELYVYRGFAYDIYNDKELINFKELEPYRNNLKILFNQYDLLDELDPEKTEISRCYAFRDFINSIIKFVKLLGNIKLKEKTVDAIRTGLLPTPAALLRFLRALYMPETFKNDYESYFWICKYLFFDADRYWKYHKVDTGNQVLNGIYRYLKEIEKHNYALYDRIKYNDYVTPSTLIASYLHQVNKLTYEEFSEYMDNMDYYLERLSLNNINRGNFNTYHMDIMLYVVNNFENLFRKERGLIK